MHYLNTTPDRSDVKKFDSWLSLTMLATLMHVKIPSIKKLVVRYGPRCWDQNHERRKCMHINFHIKITLLRFSNQEREVCERFN